MSDLITDGKLDDGNNCGGPAFGTGGKTTTDFFDEYETLSALLLLPHGKILVGGTASRDVPNGWDQDFALALYNADGSLDSSFSQDGRETADFGDVEDLAYALALQLDGKILISGESGGHLAMARYLYTRISTYLPMLRR